jgi:hypothetical protein
MSHNLLNRFCSRPLAHATGMLASIALVIAVSACGSEPGEAATPDATFRVSECGGFTPRSAKAAGADTYCDAEVLDWQYDNTKQQLTLINKRAVLNCCGDRSQVVVDDAGVIVVRQTDAPAGGGGRCRCDCSYDFEAVIPTAPGQLRLRVERVVTDATNASPQVLFDGTLDLTGGQGSELIDPSATPFCQPSTPTPTPTPLPFTAAVSECGGFSPAKPGDTPAPLPLPLPPAPADYCKAEVLAWSHDAASGRLELRDSRVLLNCCGDRAIKATLENGVYVLRETDGPEGGAAGARCNCLCVFDFDLIVEGVKGNSIDVELRRDVLDDNSKEQVVWAGKLDLTQLSGQIVVDSSDAEGFCNP